jgi:hypothetical protein
VEPCGGGSGVGSGQYPPAMANFAMSWSTAQAGTPRVKSGDQAAWGQHAAFMDGLVEDGFIILGGPVGQGEQTLHRTAPDRHD